MHKFIIKDNDCMIINLNAAMN